METNSVSAAEAREALAFVLSSQQLRSARSRALLTFLVEETIEGRGDRLKAYSIATLLLDRDSNFDPQGDSIVRVEASKLRRALEIYYETEGARDQIAIVLPRGSYRVEFVRRLPAPGPQPEPAIGGPEARVMDVSARPNKNTARSRRLRHRRNVRLAAVGLGLILAAASTVALWRHFQPSHETRAAISTTGRLGPKLILEPFQAQSGSDEDRRRVAEFRLDLSHALSRFGRFEFHDGESGAKISGNAYAVSVRQTGGNTLLVAVRSRATDEIIWSSEVALGGDRTELIRSLVTPIASPYGAIFSHERRMLATAPDSDGEACLLRTIDALRRGDPDQYPLCLQATALAHPDSVLAWAVLSRVHRGRYLNHGSPRDLALAREAARRGIELGSLNERARLADLEVRFLTDPKAVDPATIESIIAVNRYQADTLARAGRLEIAAGYFEQGEALIEEAGRYLPLAPMDWAMLFAADLSRGRRGRVGSWSHQLGAGNNPLVKLLAIAAAVETNEAVSGEDVAEFVRRYPDITRAPDAYLQRWSFTQATRALLLNRLQAAGIPPVRPN